MPAGAYFHGVCYPTTAQAEDAFFGSVGPALTSGSVSYLSWYEKNTVWQQRRQSIASNGVVTDLGAINATLPAFATCDPTESFFDGMTLGWGLAAVMVIAWCIRKMRP